MKTYGPFTVHAEKRPYDHHRPHGCTVLAIRLADWPGNEFGLWLPETLVLEKDIAWCNWTGDTDQDWEERDDAFAWRKRLAFFEIVSTLTPDPAARCLRYVHRFTNTSDHPLAALSSQTCFHLVNAPQFISIGGERIWVCLDGEWNTSDRVPRSESPDPRRVSFAREGRRRERTVVRNTDFPSALMPEQASHPLVIAENFDGTGSVGIACRNFATLSNNNDSILRCIHSEPFPIEELAPGESAEQEGVLLFHRGGHDSLRRQFEDLVDRSWLLPGRA